MHDLLFYVYLFGLRFCATVSGKNLLTFLLELLMLHVWNGTLVTTMFWLSIGIVLYQVMENIFHSFVLVNLLDC